MKTDTGQTRHVACDFKQSPAVWVDELLRVATNQREVRVKRHLVGAALDVRHPRLRIPIWSPRDPDWRDGGPDYLLWPAAYYVVARPTPQLLRRCLQAINQELTPLVIVPRSRYAGVKSLLRRNHIQRRVAVFAMEDFLVQKLMGLVPDEAHPFVEALREIIDAYNRRIAVAEADASLAIELD